MEPKNSPAELHSPALANAGAAGHAERRVPELDGIRGIAVIGITIFHAVLVCDFALIPWAGLVRWAHACVDLFFVLSGYLITGILLSSLGAAKYFANFYARRTLRIFPAYFFVLGLVFVVLPFFSSALATSVTVDQFWLYALFLQNWDYAFNGWSDWPYINHFWSLAVEEQFYLCWPLVVMVAGRKRLPAICLGVFFASLLVLAVNTAIANPGKFAYTSTITRMGAISAGAFVASVDRATWRAWMQHPQAWLCAALALYAIFVVWTPAWIPARHAVAMTVATLTPAVLLALIHGDSLPRLVGHLLRLRVLGWFGSYSYGLYLLHYPLIGVLAELFSDELAAAMHWSPGLTPILFSLLVFILCLPLTVLMFHGIEAPALRFKHLFAARHTNPQLPAAMIRQPR